MSDLSNITTLSGLTIESDQSTGTNNINATFTVPCVSTAQRDKLENVTPYVVNGATVKIKQGTIIFNITVDKLQIFRNGGWESVSTNTNTATGAGLDSSPFAIPTGTKVDVETLNAVNAKDGLIYYATDIQRIRAHLAGNWYTLYGMFESTSAAGIGPKVPFIFPEGTKTEVEINENKEVGFTYVENTTKTLRTYGRNNEWYTIDKEN